MSLPKSFPIDVRELEEWIPHRPPMLWISEVSWADATSGECVARIEPEGHALGKDGIMRSSSMIEWIAQSYAFVRAAQALTGAGPAHAKPKRVFLVAINDARFEYLDRPGLLDGENSFRVRVKTDRELGPLSLVEGKVLSRSGELLASAKLKLFAE